MEIPLGWQIFDIRVNGRVEAEPRPIMLIAGLQVLTLSSLARYHPWETVQRVHNQEAPRLMVSGPRDLEPRKLRVFA